MPIPNGCSSFIVTAVVQLLNHVQLFATPWAAAPQAPLFFTVSQTLLRFMSIELVILSTHLIPCHSCLILPSVFPRSRVFSSELALHIRWPKYWIFGFSIILSSEYSGLISFRIDWFYLLVIQGTLKVFSNTTVRKHQFFGAQPSLWSNSHILTWLLKKL